MSSIWNSPNAAMHAVLCKTLAFPAIRDSKLRVLPVHDPCQGNSEFPFSSFPLMTPFFAPSLHQ